MFHRCGTFGQIIGKIFHNFMNTLMQGLNFDIPIRHQTRRYYLNFTAILLTSRSIYYNVKFNPAIMSQLGVQALATICSTLLGSDGYIGNSNPCHVEN